MNDNIIIGIDLAKNIMHLVQVDKTGKKVGHKKLKRDELLHYLSSIDKATVVAMEACSGCNYWSQEICNLGLQVKLLKTKDVKIYAKSRQKNDYNDGLAICKAAMDPELKSVKAKSKEEQDISFLHKARMNTIKDRVQRTNSLMSSLFEYGYVTKLSKSAFCRGCSDEVKQAYEAHFISDQIHSLLIRECDEIKELCEKEKYLDKAIGASNKRSKKAIKLQKIMGIGPINASCLSIAPIETYPTPRDFSASLGLVPRQNTSGDKVYLGSITKQGDRYARTMLIQAGRSIAMRAKVAQKPKDRLLQWAQKKFAENKPFNVVCVGLANKLARIAYSVIINGTEYEAI